MRIMLVISSLRRGGAERIVSVMANEWLARGQDVILVTIEAARTDAYQLRPGVARLALDLARVSRNPFYGGWNNLRRIWSLRRVVRRYRPDAVVSFVTHTNLLALMALIGTGLPVIVSERIDPSQMNLGVLRETLRKRLYPRATAIVVQTGQVGQRMQRTMPRAKFVVIPNPVPATDPDAQERDVHLHELVHLPPGTKVVAAMGRLDPQKGFDLLIEAFSELAARYPEWYLVIFGEGPLRSVLEAQIERSRLEARVHMPGVVRAARQYLAEADLFVLSSRFEGFPNALLEAMACGLPAVSFDCPSGPSEIIRDGYDGVLVEAGNVEALGSAMSALMDSSARRGELGKSARQVLERFSLDRIMAMWDQSLVNVITRRERKRC